MFDEFGFKDGVNVGSDTIKANTAVRYVGPEDPNLYGSREGGFWCGDVAGILATENPTDERKLIPTDDYVWKTIQTTVRFPRRLIRQNHGIVPHRMDLEIRQFKERVRFLMGPLSPGLKDAEIRASSRWEENCYEVMLKAALKVYVPRLDAYLKDLRDQEDRKMEMRKAADFTFVGLAVQTPKQWEQVEPLPGEVLELPKPVVAEKVIIAKDSASAEKVLWAEATKVAGVDAARIEVLVRPFLR